MLSPAQYSLTVQDHDQSFVHSFPQASQIEDYFSAAADDAHKTSDRTLARLCRMDVEEIREALEQVRSAPYEPMIQALRAGYDDRCFTRWMYLLW